MQQCRTAILEGQKDVIHLMQNLEQSLLRIKGLSIDYLDIVDYNTFLSVQSLDVPVIVAVAVFVGRARLIDHIEVDVKKI